MQSSLDTDQEKLEEIRSYMNEKFNGSIWNVVMYTAYAIPLQDYIRIHLIDGRNMLIFRFVNTVP